MQVYKPTSNDINLETKTNRKGGKTCRWFFDFSSSAMLVSQNDHVQPTI